MITVANRHHLARSLQFTDPLNLSPDEPNYVYIGRGTAFGNYVGEGKPRKEAIRLYRKHLESPSPEFIQAAIPLIQAHQRGYNVVLVCSCAPLPCHGDELAYFLEDGADFDFDALLRTQK